MDVEVKYVVSGYGLYVDGELVLTLKSLRNAIRIKSILVKDEEGFTVDQWL